MTTLLLYPPITDPTSGYHSLCYLETYARQHGFDDIDILDTNIESFLYTIRPDQIERIRSHIENRFQELTARTELNAADQLELFHLWKAQSFDFDRLPAAVQAMRVEETFYDYSTYRPATELILSWLGVLSLFGYPGQFSGFSLPVHGQFNLMSSQDMSDPDICAKIAAPFEPYMRDVLLPQIAEKGYRTVGINVTYCAQLPFALTIGRMIRAAFPDIILLYGGTEVADVWKYLQRKSRYFEIFDMADACVVGEGEVAFTSLLETIRDGGAFTPIANTLFHPKYGHTLLEPIIEYGGIAELPTPDYDKLNWDLYLSPHNYVYYSPSRGCYWNKCTFCDYGLNFESPTSPWRQNPVEKIIEDLRVISQKHKYVYFSVDVLSPALLLSLAERLIEEKIDIRWGAEIRLEKYWSPERCMLLKASGCTDISVGFESGNQRILNLINKGTQVGKIRETIQNFHDANIGVQVMGFTGFPTESLQDGLDSIEFLYETKDRWTFGGLGTFVLTPGAIVAKQPESFGLQNVKAYENEDIARSLYFEDPTGVSRDEDREKLKKAKGKLSKSHFDRPWVGGIDTGHTMFYHDRFGVGIIDELDASRKFSDPQTVWKLNGTVQSDIALYPIDRLYNKSDLANLHNADNKQGKGVPGREIQNRLAQQKIARADAPSHKRFFLRSDGTLYPFPETMLEFLLSFADGRSLQDVLDSVAADQREACKGLFDHSVKHHFLRPLSVAADARVPQLQAE